MTSSSGSSTDRRRSDCLSESHQPRTLRTRCSSDSRKQVVPRQALSERNRPQFPDNRFFTVPGTVKTPKVCQSIHRPSRRRAYRSRKKCTEPVAPSSGLPTDRRRSDCRSEGHQPRTLRTRCIGDSRGRSTGPSRPRNPNSSHFAKISFRTAYDCASTRVLWIKRELPGRPTPGSRPGNAAKEFAEPGTLSSTFPTGFPLSRTAARGASSYRRPVLGARSNLCNRTCPFKGGDPRSSRKLHTSRSGLARASRSANRH